MTNEFQRALAELDEAMNNTNIPVEVRNALLTALQKAEFNPTREARRVLAAAFKDDPAFRDTCVANIACVIMDFEKSIHEPDSTHAPMTHAHRQELADKILRHILET